ncbi:MAG TPA: hypothetical protein VGM57_07660 [Pseudolabrys sp.]|jgi:hypothetical protein
MRAIATLGLLLVLPALIVPAQAKLVTGATQPAITISVDDTAITTGPAGTLIESSYFNAPHAPVGYGNQKSCRLPLSLFEKTRLARACN